MQLSKHFTLREMTNSMTAQRKGIDNTPTQDHIDRIKILCSIKHVDHVIVFDEVASHVNILLSDTHTIYSALAHHTTLLC